MEDHNGPVTSYKSSFSTAATAGGSPRNSYYNYQPNRYHHQRQYPDPVPGNLTFRDILIMVAGFVSLIFLTTIAIRWYCFRDRRPEFRVDSFSLSNLTFTNGSRVFIISEIQLTTRNPNLKSSLFYDHIATSVYYKNELLSQTGLSPFSQERKNKTSLVAKFSGDGNTVEKWVVDGINGEIEENGNVELNFWLVSSINWVYSDWWNSSDILRVFCGDLAVGIPRNGSPGGLIVLPGPCRVGKGGDVRNFIR